MLKKLTGAALFAVMAFSAGAPALAQTTTASGTTNTTASVDVACVKAAIDARDGALATAATAFGQAWGAAFTARATALKAAWDLTGKARRMAVAKADKDFAAARRTARAAFETARKNAWATFKTSAKTCHISASEAGNAGGDSL